MPHDERIMKHTEIQKVTNRYQDVNKNEVKFRRKIPVDIQNENNKQKMEILITERTDITPLLGMDWMKTFKLPIGRIQLTENNQSEKEKIINKFPDLFENNETIKDTEIKIQLKPGHLPVKQKARPVPLHLQEDVGRELEKLINAGRLEKIKDVDEDCFVSPVVITVKSDKSVKIALDSQKLNDSCVKTRPHMPNMEELLNQISVEITRDRTTQLFMSKINGQRKALSRPGTLRRRYDHQTQRTVFAPSRPNKRSKEEIAEIDAELIRRANRLGGGYQPLIKEQEEQPDEIREEGELENNETEEDSVVMPGDNLPIVDLSKYNTEGKETKYIQIKHIVGKLTTNKKATEDHIKRAEFEFMLDLKTLISKTAIDPELTRVRNSMRREDRETIPDGYRTVFDKLSIRCGLIFVDDQIVIPIDLRRRLLDILHFGHSGITKMTTEAKTFWWPNKKQDIETKVKD